MSEMTHLLNGELIGEHLGARGGREVGAGVLARGGGAHAAGERERERAGGEPRQGCDGRGAQPGEWEFPAAVLPRLRIVGRLMRDLGVNVSGAALAVELLETQRELERQIRRLERLGSGQG